MLVPRARCYSFPYLKVVAKSFLDFRTEVDYGLVSAFSNDADTVIPKVKILYVQTDTFRHSNACSEQESYDGEITFACLLIVAQGFSGELIATVFDIIEKNCDLIRIEAYDRLFMDFGHINQDRRVSFDHFLPEQITVEAPESR